MLKIEYFTGGIAQTNGYLLTGDGGQPALIVDAPEGMADWLRSKGITPEVLLLTHQHFDHCQDAALIQRELGAKIHAFAPFSRELTLEFLMGFVGGTRFAVDEFTVNQLLEGQAETTACGLTWQLAHVPGHSPDSITFYLAEEQLLFGGDVLFEGSIGRTDFPGGSQELLLSGIAAKVLTLPDKTRVLPGHGDETTVGEERESNPYLSS